MINFFVVCFKLFPVFCFFWIIYFIQFILVYKWPNLFLFFHGLVQLLSRTENIYHYFLVFGFIVAFLIYSKKPVFEPPQFKLILYNRKNNPSTQSDTKVLPFLDCSKPTWCLWKRKLKSSSMISFLSTPILISFCCFQNAPDVFHLWLLMMWS